jgi:hypothetical protein
VSRRSSNLRALFHGLEALYETQTGLDPHSLLVPFEGDDATPREVLFLREDDDGLEVGLALDHDTLEHLESTPADHVLGDERLGRTLPVLEGLSHLCYVAEAARCERPVSGLELETQAEVDKLALCLLHRWPRAREDFGRLVDRLYYRFELIPENETLRQRYQTANRVALGFSRQLQPHVDAGHLSGLRSTLRRFWHASMPRKRALAGG